MSTNFLGNRNSNLSQFKAVSINYSTVNGSSIIASTLINVSSISVSTIYDSTINTNSASVNGLLNVTGPLQFYGNLLVPIGCIMLYYNSSIPAGWALCNGQTVTRTDGGGSITTPNLVGQFVYGSSTATAGNTGGSSTQTLTTTHIPSHNHGVTDPGHNHSITDNGHGHSITDNGHNHTATDAGHSHGITDNGHSHTYSGYQYRPCGNDSVRGGSDQSAPDCNWWRNTLLSNSTLSNITIYNNYANVSVANANTGISVNNAKTGISLGSATTGISIQNTGSGTAFNIMPPYIVLCYIMKY